MARREPVAQSVSGLRNGVGARDPEKVEAEGAGALGEGGFEPEGGRGPDLLLPLRTTLP